MSSGLFFPVYFLVLENYKNISGHQSYAKNTYFFI